MTILLVLLGLVTALLLYLGTRHPSHDRTWTPEQAVMARAELTGDTAVVHGVRNFRWTSSTAFTPAWEDRTYHLDRIATAWYVVVPFSRHWRGPAHAFVSFGFDDGAYVAISVEARRELGQTYGLIKGMFRAFELMYVFGDEQDLIGRRAVFDGHDVFVYPIRAERARVRAMFRAILERANALAAAPEFYNTLTNNCTLNLQRHVVQVTPGRVPTSWRIIVPGYSDEVALRLGLIDSTLTLVEARRRFRINDRARAAFGSRDFSARIRD